MKNIIFIFLFFPTITFCQFSPRTLTKTPWFYTLGQSNAENFWKADLYSSSTVRCAERLADSMELYWGVPLVRQSLYASAGKALAKIPTDIDWNVDSQNELYNGFGTTLLSDPNPTSFNPHWDQAFSNGQAPEMRFLLWIQGETDASDNSYANVYYLNIKNLISGFRATFKNPNLPVVIVKLGDDIVRGSLGPVRSAQQRIADEDANVYIVNIDDFSQNGAEYNGPTNVHYSENGLLKILQRIVNITKNL